MNKDFNDAFEFAQYLTQDVEPEKRTIKHKVIGDKHYLKSNGRAFCPDSHRGRQMFFCDFENYERYIIEDLEPNKFKNYTLEVKDRKLYFSCNYSPHNPSNLSGIEFADTIIINLKTGDFKFDTEK